VGGDVQPGTHIVNCAVAASVTTPLSLAAMHSWTQAEVMLLPHVPVTG
jgi:hypothetical protein